MNLQMTYDLRKAEKALPAGWQCGLRASVFK